MNVRKRTWKYKDYSPAAKHHFVIRLTSRGYDLSVEFNHRLSVLNTQYLFTHTPYKSSSSVSNKHEYKVAESTYFLFVLLDRFL